MHDTPSPSAEGGGSDGRTPPLDGTTSGGASRRFARSRSSRGVLLVVVLAAAAGVGAGGYAALAPRTTMVVREVSAGGSAPASRTTALSVGQIYERSYKGVVEIMASTQSSAFGGSQTQEAQGSGFFYDARGNIVTNAHVVDGATSISVKLWNGNTYKATLVGSDASTDLAVLHVNAPASLLTPLALGDSSNVRVGDGVVAIGSPFGLEETVTAGIVSALHRQMKAPNNFTINDSIQTDAAINHGNSGGPLLNAAGRVIGVNAQIESDSGGSDGVGFAIPANTVRSIASRLVRDGTVEHAYLGVAVATIPSSAASELGLPAGAEIQEVGSGTPAAKAGLRAATGSRIVGGDSYPTGGDVVTAVDGSAVTRAEQLQSAIDAKRPGDTISITFVRDGRSRTVQLTLATRPS